MAKYSFLCFIFEFFILASIIMLVCDANDENKKPYIVYMGSLPNVPYSPTSHHLRMIQEVTNGDDDASNFIIRSYHKSFNGFSAMLNDQQREKLTKMEGVISVFPSKTLHLQTTRSWDFMGFQDSLVQRNQTRESDVIIGVIDSGIWPESDSFSDEGFGPVPKKWKGKCDGGNNFTCNNKVIGARHYYSYFGGSESARDTIGHGSHSASIAAGNKVSSVSFYGMAEGDARGGVPSSRIAIYSVCQSGCPDDSILAAFDDAIADGVDLITISMAIAELVPFEKDSIAIGSFHAMEKGILTLNCAGNSGPKKGSINSVAPWLFSVAASTIDRRIIDKVSLGNGLTLVGKSINTFSSNGTKIPLISGKFASYPNCSSPEEAESCDYSCVDPTKAKGKILLCSSDDGYTSGYRAGVFGSITKSEAFESDVVAYPSISIDSNAYDLAMSYANSTNNPKAELLSSETIHTNNAPIVAGFSARGPNSIIPEIMKPDITAPGVEILASFSPIASISNNPNDKRSVKYNILSGTSMSCPHVAGIAAYVKSFHPSWSPAAIKSAIMTTAKAMNGSEDHKEFAYGSGHVDPVKAINPGLVFDLSKDHYVNLLCNIGYNTSKVRLISGDNSTCNSSSPQRSKVKDVNYPSIAIRVEPMKPFIVNVTRTVTNVGFANSTYKVSVQQNSDLKITVVPKVLSFGSLEEKQSFVVNVVGGNFAVESVVSSAILWTDETHSVRCPIVVNVSNDA